MIHVHVAKKTFRKQRSTKKIKEYSPEYSET